jgi:hypothetical protein
MDIKKTAMDSLKTAKFEGVTVNVDVVNSRLQVSANLKGSIDLPGDMDAIVAQVAGALGVGNSPQPSPSSGN